MAAKTEKLTIRSVRDAYLAALVTTLKSLEKHAKSDSKADAEVVAHYAAAAKDLMETELGKQLVVGVEGLTLT